MTDTATTPARTTAADAFNDAYADAKNGRRAAVAAAAAFAATLIRPHFPAATTISVDTTDGELRTIRDADRSALWYAPASAGAGLPDAIAEDIADVMRDILELGAHETALEDAGWTNPDAYDDVYDLELPGTPDARERREYIIAGVNRGTGYTLWDIAPAPTDPDKRTRILEELGVDAADALGAIETVWAATAREAVTTLLAELGQRSGLADYGLTDDSNTDCLGPAGTVEAGTQAGEARAATLVGGTLHEVHGTFEPGPAELVIADAAGAPARETRDRIRAAIANSGIQWPVGALTVRTGWAGQNAAGDLAVACAALAAAGYVPAAALEYVAIVGELGLDGTVRPSGDVPAAVRAAREAGRRTAIVPAEHGALDLPGGFVCGASNLGDALALLERGAQVIQ
ncbi:magnesium chelatase domain-containing protein [Streptomyces sp. NPDC006207]